MPCVKFRRCFAKVKRVSFLKVLLLTLVVCLTIAIVEIVLERQKLPLKHNDYKLLVDNTKRDFLDELEEVPNLPVTFWKASRWRYRFNTSCARLPDVFQLSFSNTLWQTLRVGNETFQLFSAHKDVRKRNGGQSVRILTMIDNLKPTAKTSCQLWFREDTTPAIVPVEEYTYIWNRKWEKNGIYQPFMATCKIPKQSWDKTLEAVSVVEKPCDTATNLLKVTYNPSSAKKGFAVCVKGLDFPEDLSVRLVEWIELLLLLGADKVIFYKYWVHHNVAKILKYYQDEDLVEVNPLTLPSTFPNIPYLRHLFKDTNVYQKRRLELMDYNDCFYKHMYEYEYILLLDIDEIIMPIREISWRGLVEALKRRVGEKSSYAASCAFFLEEYRKEEKFDIPDYMHMLHNVYRTDVDISRAIDKSFFNTDLVVTLHNHHPLSCFGGCKDHLIDKRVAHLQHYRAHCPPHLKCKEYRESSVKDITIWKFKKRLTEKVTNVLKYLGILVPL